MPFSVCDFFGLFMAPRSFESISDGGKIDFQTLRTEMVEKQLRQRGIRDAGVLKVMQEIPRERFIPGSEMAKAYQDSPLPIGSGQTISQPYIVAYMTELLRLSPEDKVLEIGTGSGYQTAVLASLAKEIYTVEIFEGLCQIAQQRLKELDFRNISFLRRDGWRGWAEKAPFDKVMVTAAPSRIPREFVKQLEEGGRLVIPIGEEQGVQKLCLGVKQSGILKTMDTIAVRFVPLVQS